MRFPAPNRVLMLAAVFCLGLVPAAGVAHDDHRHADPDHCICATANATNAWCGKCGAGTVAGVRVDSPVIYELLDPHGHDVDLTHVDCPTCHAALESHGYCESCRIGYSDGRAYVSRITWLLARATWLDPGKIDCGFCREHLGGSAWCETCGHGLLGGYAFGDRESFTSAIREQQRLLDALQFAKECEYCGAARFAGGRCPLGEGHYEAAVPAPLAPPPPSARSSEGNRPR